MYLNIYNSTTVKFQSMYYQNTIAKEVVLAFFRPYLKHSGSDVHNDQL